MSALPLRAPAPAGPIAAWRDGRLTPVDKLEVHRLGLRHPAVSVFVNDGGRTLLQRRAAGKYHTPGLWANACCTHPDWGETPAACARRRLGEELGVTHLALSPRGRIEYRAELENGMVEHEVVDLFAAEADAGALRLDPDPREVWETRWIARAELRDEIAASPERFTPWLRIYLQDAADRLIPAG